MTDLERRHRKATARVARWTAAANNARAMGEVTDLHEHGGGSLLVRVAETAIRTFGGHGHEASCRCEPCVAAWETAASDVERMARYAGVDPKRHTYSAASTHAPRSR